jgi:hypothetical protein
VLLREPLREPVEARQVEVDDLVGAGLVAGCCLATARRPGLQQARGEVPRLGEQEQADLRDVRAGRHVDEDVVLLGIECQVVRERQQQVEHLLEVPGIAQVGAAPLGFGLGRDGPDIGENGLGELGVAPLAEQHEALHEQVLVLAHRDVRPPVVPPVLPDAAVELRAEEADHGVSGRTYPCGSFSIASDRPDATTSPPPRSTCDLKPPPERHLRFSSPGDSPPARPSL